MRADSQVARRPPDMLSDPTRLRLAWAPVRREPASQQPAAPRMARLVGTRRRGTTIRYSLENDRVRQPAIDAEANAEARVR